MFMSCYDNVFMLMFSYLSLFFSDYLPISSSAQFPLCGVRSRVGCDRNGIEWHGMNDGAEQSQVVSAARPVKIPRKLPLIME